MPDKNMPAEIGGKQISNGRSADSPKPTHYVGIGASAGGLEAIESFFKNMALKSGMAFVVVQHLSPDYKSLMKELLSKRTKMPVYRAEEGMRVLPDSVYLIPPKKNLTIFHGKLLLSDQNQVRGINLPIDIFFRSLADDQGEKSVGVILSGTGSDGMRGVRAIKEAGGMVMVQDEESAKFDGMPRSAISTGVADFILPPEQMPDQLLSYAKHPYVTKAERTESLLTDEDGMTRIFALIREQTKVDFTSYKPSTVVRRIQRRMTVNQISDLRDYVRYMEANPAEITRLYQELLIGVTRFFRDTDVFQTLGEKCLPELVSKKEGHEFRCWVPGCSTGEEAYTIAILLKECMEVAKKTMDVKIFATDIDKRAILVAGNGEYPESITADLSPTLLAKYFYRNGENFQIARYIREMVVFAQHNLIKDPPFTNIDLISCRNLLIYLQPVLQKKALELFNFSLNPEGILLLGTSETTGEASDYFEALHHKWKIYRSRGRRKPTRKEYESGDMPFYLKESLSGALPATRRRVLQHHQEEWVLNRLLQSLSEDYIPLTIVVNEQMEIVHIIGDSKDCFRLPSGKMDNDIIKMAVKDLSIPLATGLQRVFQSGKDVNYTNIRLEDSGTGKFYQMRIRSLPQKRGQSPLAVIFLKPADVRKREEKRNGVQEYDIGKEAQQRIADLEQELQFTKENLQATIEELETSNEELQATNEELLASNEELQSTNEELHSVNEELYTVNAEYQSKIIELTELNNDINNLFNSTEIGKLFLDENFEIRKFTPHIGSIYRITEKDIGRPLSHLNHLLENGDPLAMMREVHNTGKPMEKEVRNTEGHHYLMRIFPYRIGPDTWSGLVLTFIEIDQLKEAQEKLESSRKMLKETAHLAKVGSWEYDVKTGIQKWSAEVFHIHELDTDRQPPPEEGIGYYAPSSRPVITEAFEKLMADGTPYDLVLELDTAKGNRRWVRAIGRAEEKDGEIVKVYGAFQDISNIREAEKALRESEESYQMLFEKSLNGFALHEIITDENNRPVDYRFLEINSAFEKMTGLKREDIMGKKVTDVMPGIRNDPFDWIGEYGKVARGGDPIRFENHSGPLNRWYSVLAYSPSPDHFVTVFDDITERKLAEETLRENDFLLKKTQEMAHVGSWRLDLRQNVLYWSDEVYRIFGADPNEFGATYEAFMEYVHPDDREMVDRIYKTSVEQNESYDVVHRVLRKDGRVRIVHEKSENIVDESGKTIVSIGMVHDITESKLADERLGKYTAGD